MISTIQQSAVFLSDRTQNVKHNGQLSGLRSITCIVPQDRSIKFGPAIFTVIVNDAAKTYRDGLKFVDDLILAEVC